MGIAKPPASGGGCLLVKMVSRNILLQMRRWRSWSKHILLSPSNLHIHLFRFTFPNLQLFKYIGSHVLTHTLKKILNARGYL